MAIKREEQEEVTINYNIALKRRDDFIETNLYLKNLIDQTFD